MKKDKLNKKELISDVSKNLSNVYVTDDDTRNQMVKLVIDEMLSEIVKSMRDGKKVSLSSFGSFEIKRHKGHGISIGNEDRDSIGDYLCVKFRPSIMLTKKIRSEVDVEKF